MENQIIDFAQWYSGMDRSKGEAAYRRYLREQPEAMSQSDISGSLPPQVKFELQKIALADDEMVTNAGAAVTYREMIRNILKVHSGNDR
jgi:hypothetical protein